MCIHQRLERDQLKYCDLDRERQSLAYQLVQEQHIMAPSRIASSIQGLNIIFDERLLNAVGSQKSVKHDLTAVQQRRDMADERVLKSELSLD